MQGGGGGGVLGARTLTGSTEPSQDGAASPTCTLPTPVQSPSWDCTHSGGVIGAGLGGGVCKGRGGVGEARARGRRGCRRLLNQMMRV